MRNQVLHYFVDTNSSRGAVNFYNSNFQPLQHTVQLHAYPPALLANLLSGICSRAEEEKLDVECIHNCLDNSLEGIIVPELSAGVINIPSYREYNALNLLEDHNIKQVLEALEQSHQFFRAALKVHDAWEKVYIDQMDFAAANQLTEKTIDRLIGDQRLEKQGTEVHRFFGAATINGAFDHIANITQCLGKRYFIKGRPGTGKSTFLKKIAQKAVEAGFRVEIYHCAFDPQSLDMIVLRELDFCLFDSTSPHEYFPSLPTDEVIDIYEAAVTPGTDEANAAALVDFAKGYKAEVAKATEKLRLAKELYDRFQQTHLSRISEEALRDVSAQIENEMFQKS